MVEPRHWGSTNRRINISREYTNQQLERMVQGTPEDPNTVFYEQSKMNPDLSKEAGKRVYQTVLMVKYTQPGVTDWAPARAQKEDIASHPVEYQRFLDTRDDVGSPSIDIIPGITPDAAQELIDYGLLTVTKLCEAKTLPEHLKHIQESAWRIQEVLKSEQKANKEGKQEINSGIYAQTDNVHEADRRNHTGDVIRRVPAGGEVIPAGETAKGSRAGGRIDNRTGVGWDNPNWSLTFNG